MKMKLLIVFLAITAALCCTFGFAGCFLNTSFSLKYSAIEENGEIIAYSVVKGPRGKVEIPSTHNGKPVTEIGDGAFEEGLLDFNRLESVTIPDSVTTIGKTAFFGCCDLKSVTIPESVTSIGVNAFAMSGITSIYYAGDLLSWCKISGLDGLMSGEWDVSLYIDGKKLQDEIIIPDGITEIGDGTFRGCKDITSVTIPSGVTSIGERAFSRCCKLKSINIPEKVTSISYEVFSDCGSLTSLTLPEGVTSISDKAFSGCSSLTSLTLPNSLISIGEYAFSDCGSLTSLTIPVGVTSIGFRVFDGYNRLESITVAEGNTVYHSAGNCLIKTEVKELILGCKNSVIPDDGSVITIGDDAFGGCDGLENITIPAGVMSIGFWAFKMCKNLTDINFMGTKARWNAIISKSGSWDTDTGNYTVHCTDGDIVKPVYE